MQHIDLLHGRILPSLAGLAMPIMATSLIQTAYNLTDMAWIGFIGSPAVTAVGTAGMYIWLSGGIVTLARMGAQIKTAQSVGQQKLLEAAEYAGCGIQLTLLLAVVLGLLTNLFAEPLIGFFGLSSPQIVNDSVIYLRLACGLIVFSFLNQTLTGLFTAIGDSKTPFLANSIGLIMNMVLDPVLIFGWGPLPRMEVAGAAIATVTAQFIVTAVMVWRAFHDPLLFDKVRIWKIKKRSYYTGILRLGFPSSAQNILYSSISLVLTRLVASWGDTSIAIQRVGGQVEGISWSTAEGFGAAMNAFIGQNYGARQYDRMKKSYKTAAVIMFIWGILTTAFLVFGAEPLFRLFIREAEIVPAGVRYLMILGFAQMFMCEEFMTIGALQGMGETMSASVISIVLTAARIPLAMVLSSTELGLDGIWWALTASSMAKGIVFVGYYVRTLKTLPASDYRGKGAMYETGSNE